MREKLARPPATEGLDILSVLPSSDFRMSILFFKRVLANPLRVGYVVPSSPFLTRQTARRIDFSRPRVVVELGPGEGCHTRQIVKRMDPHSRLILFELDEEFVSHLRKQFVRDPRVTVLNTDALHLPRRSGTSVTRTAITLFQVSRSL